MKPKVRAVRALTAYTATKSLRLVSIIVLVIFIVAVGLVWLLAAQLSSWWWIMLLPVLILGFIAWLVRLIIQRIIRATYPDPLSQNQREALEGLSDKVVRLAEARSTPLPILALITLKDIIIKRDATTIRSLFNDSKSLAGDLRGLERHFKER